MGGGLWPQAQVEERPVAGHGDWQRFATAGRGPGCGAGQRVCGWFSAPSFSPMPDVRLHREGGCS